MREFPDLLCPPQKDEVCDSVDGNCAIRKDVDVDNKVPFGQADSAHQCDPLLPKHKLIKDTASDILGLKPTEYLSFEDAIKCCSGGKDIKPTVTCNVSWVDNVDIELCKSMNRLILGQRAKFMENVLTTNSDVQQPGAVELSSFESHDANNKLTKPEEKPPDKANCTCEESCLSMLEAQPQLLREDPQDESSSEGSLFTEESSASDDFQYVSDESSSDGTLSSEDDGSSEDNSSVDGSSDTEDIESENEDSYHTVMEPPHYHPDWGSLRHYPAGEAWDEAPWCKCYACESYRQKQATTASSRSVLNWSCQIFTKYTYYIRQMLMRRSVYFNTY